jgi:hypothetical protein
VVHAKQRHCGNSECDDERLYQSLTPAPVQCAVLCSPVRMN